MRDFRYSILVTIVGLLLAGWWGHHTTGTMAGVWAALVLALILSIMEISLSFDNAVVNASILKDMDEKWRQLFLTVGILIAVFGVRLIFPLLLVAVATSQGFIEVANMALTRPDEYSRHLMEGHTAIASFGGTFLFLVFLSFILNDAKELHWLGKFEEQMAKLGKLDSMGIFITLVVLLVLHQFLPVTPEKKMTILLAGVAGVVLYIAVDSLGSFFSSKADAAAVTGAAKRNGVMGFLYLEILDASFSFDGVIGAFAITRDVVIIMLGLTIGAMFVRSLTVHFVYRGTLQKYVYLEHGAHYAIGILGLIMFYSIYEHVPEVITGLIGVVFIVASLISSIVYKRKVEAQGISNKLGESV